MVQCPKCQHIQEETNYCIHCGTSLRFEDQNESEISKQVIEEEKNERNLTVSSFNWKGMLKRLGWHMLIIALFTWGLLNLLSILIAKLPTSPLIVDSFYRLFSKVGDLDLVNATYLSEKIAKHPWYYQVLFHGGVLEGRITGDFTDEFYFHFTILSYLIVPIVTLVAIIFSHHRVWPSKEKLSGIESLFLCIGSAIIYSFLQVITLYIIQPKVKISLIESVNLQLSSPNSSIVLFSISIFGLGFFVYYLWKNGIHTFKRIDYLLQPIFQFWKIWLIGAAIIGLTMLGTWIFSNSQFIERPFITLQELWDEYHTDFQYYLLIPNIIGHEQIYSIGNIWTLKGSSLRYFIDSSSSITFHMMKGNYGGIWYPFAFLILYIYALIRVNLREQKTILIFSLIQGLILAILGAVLSVHYQSNTKLFINNAKEYLGFSFWTTLIITALVTASILYVNANKERFIKNRREGETQHE